MLKSLNVALTQCSSDDVAAGIDMSLFPADERALSLDPFMPELDFGTELYGEFDNCPAAALCTILKLYKLNVKAIHFGLLGWGWFVIHYSLDDGI